MPANDLDKRYKVQLCATCEHPGGQHIEGAGCHLCTCDGWEAGAEGWWTDRETIAWRERRIVERSAEYDQADAEGRLREVGEATPSVAEQIEQSHAASQENR